MQAQKLVDGLLSKARTKVWRPIEDRNDTILRERNDCCQQRDELKDALIENFSRHEWENVPVSDWPGLIRKDRDDASAALAKAVELLRATVGCRDDECVSEDARNEFLAEHGKDGR